MDGRSLTPGPGCVTSAPYNHWSVDTSQTVDEILTHYHCSLLVQTSIYLADWVGVDATQFYIDPVLDR